MAPCEAQLTRDFVARLIAFRASWFNVVRDEGFNAKFQTRERWIPRNNFSLYKFCQRKLVDLWDDPLNHSLSVTCESYNRTVHKNCVWVYDADKFLKLFPACTIETLEELTQNFLTLGIENRDPDSETGRLLAKARHEFGGSTLDTFRHLFPGLPQLLLEDLVEFVFEYYHEGVRLLHALPQFPPTSRDNKDTDLPAKCYFQEFNFAIQYHVRINDPSSAVPEDPSTYFKFRKLIEDCRCQNCSSQQ